MSEEPQTGTRDQKVEVDLADPKHATRFRSPHYVSVYANRTEVEITDWEVRLTFVQLSGLAEFVNTGRPLHLEEQAVCSLSHIQAKSLKDALNRLIADDDPRFEPRSAPNRIGA